MNTTELSTSGKEVGANVLAGVEGDKVAVTPVEVLIHLRAGLDESGAELVIQKLGQVKGVTDTRYNPLKNHLLIVSYDPRLVKPLQLLSAMGELGHQAQLVGL